MDSADYMARRQGEITRTILMGAQAGGLDDETWLQIYAERRLLADRGHISERTQRTLHYFNDYRLYRVPRRLSQLVKRLMEDFNAAQRIYTGKGLLQLAPDEEVRYVSTLSGEAPIMDEVPGWMTPMDQEETDEK